MAWLLLAVAYVLPWRLCLTMGSPRAPRSQCLQRSLSAGS
jgi:hypothetical protein